MAAVLEFLMKNPQLLQSIIDIVGKVIDMLVNHPAAQQAVGDALAKALTPK